MWSRIYTENIMDSKAVLLFIAAILVAGLSIIDSKAPYTSEVETEPLDLQLNLNISQTFKESSTKPYASVYSTVDNTKQGFVNLGSLQSFTRYLSAQEKEDVLDSILLAQLTASHMYDRDTEYTEWYKIYVRVLIKLGWMVDTYQFFQYNPPDKTINLSEATLTLLQHYCSKPNQLQVSKDLLTAYRNLLSSDHRVSIFMNHTVKLGSEMKAGFQILPAASLADGVTSLVFSNFQFSSVKTTVTRYLFYKWETEEVHLLAALSVGSLNHTQYAGYRHAVKNNIGKDAQQFVQEVPLSEETH